MSVWGGSVQKVSKLKMYLLRYKYIDSSLDKTMKILEKINPILIYFEQQSRQQP